jgi:hypothetical protein
LASATAEPAPTPPVDGAPGAASQRPAGTVGGGVYNGQYVLNIFHGAVEAPDATFGVSGASLGPGAAIPRPETGAAERPTPSAGREPMSEPAAGVPTPTLDRGPGTSAWRLPPTRARGARRRAVVLAVAVTTIVIGVVTNVVSDHPGASWWVAFGVLATVGVASHGVLTLAEGRRRAGRVGAAGSVRVRGSSGAPITTRVRGIAPESVAADGEVLGLGAVWVEGDAYGGISTDVTGPPQRLVNRTP